MIEIEHVERLTALFGHWPNFHDAALTAVRLDASGDDGPSLEADLDVFETLPEIDEVGCEATFLCDAVAVVAAAAVALAP